MAEFYDLLKPKSKYYDKKNFNNQEEYDQAVKASTTVYVGNLNYHCSQDSIKQLFSRAGKVKKIIMGINDEGQRCGFCFVIFENHKEAVRSVQYISQTKLDDKIIRVDLDPGYIEGRQKGRGRDGNQKRDDFRNKYHDNRDFSKNKYNNDKGYTDRKFDKYNNDRRQEGGRQSNRDDRYFSRDRYQRNRQQRDIGQENQKYTQEGGPRKMGKKQQEQKQQEY